MTTTISNRSLVVIQLTGANDPLNTIIPYADGHYYDFRPNVSIPTDQVIPIDGQFAFNPNMATVKALWDEGKVAIINGIGYPRPTRSHFRSMDIWHTCEPEKIATEGWLGRVIRDLDPRAENVITGVNFGRGLPRSMGAPGVPVASVGNLETYGLFPDVEEERIRGLCLDAFGKMYGGTIQDSVMDYLGQTGRDALKGADILRTAPEKYSSTVEYADNPIAQSLKNAAQVMCADLGTRVYYTQHGSFDTHGDEIKVHGGLWTQVSGAVSDFMADLEEHGRGDDAIVLVWTEFGRRVKDNGSGTDHGSGGTAFIFGNSVSGGFYGQYPSLAEEDHLDGDLHWNNDFRSTYSSIAEQWLGLDPVSIVNGQFEQFNFLRS